MTVAEVLQSPLLHIHCAYMYTLQAYPKGMPIEGIAAANAFEGVTVYHAGTKLDNGVVKVRSRYFQKPLLL
jgi:hypothetical protein